MINLEIAALPGARLRLAFLILLPVLLIAVVVITASVNALADLTSIAGTTADAGLARVGNDLALVIVTERSADIAATRSLLFNWGVLAPTSALVAGACLAWWVAGRIRATVDAARTMVAEADDERTGRLQEIVHELRTPLAVIGTNLELAEMESDSIGPSTRYMTNARRAMGRMARTVDDLAGHGGLAVATASEPVDIRRMAQSLVDESSLTAVAQGIRVVIAGVLPTTEVRGVDAAAVRTAVSNFLTNATRLAPRGSEVVVACGEIADWAWLAVTDQGPGLAPQYHARAFERGWQGAHDRDRRGGSGLGLAIARQLTEAQGGRITVESEEGGGATFALWLPTDPGARHDDIVAADNVHSIIRPWAGVSSIA